MQRKTSIIILTYNHLSLTKACLASIEQYTEKDTYEIIVVDNNSSDGTRDWLLTQPHFKLILNSENKGFPKGCNQGIQIASKENDILLLNNDTIVTENWLKNLKICLDSDPKIGAVGLVCNQNENHQGVDFTYDDFNTMQHLAKQNNQSNPKKWEDKSMLIGFCMLIKREVMNQLKGLDEAYTPGYIEDNDFSLRILTLGYRLVLCHDSFIHHYLGTEFRKDLTKFYPILTKNRAYFYQKWKFDTFTFDQIKSASFPLIDHPQKLLELDCGIGATMQSFKYQYPEVLIEGIEKNSKKRFFSSQLTRVYSNLKELGKNTYDCILIGDILEKVKNPKSLLENLKKHLTLDGYLIGEIHNAISIDKLHYLCQGYSYELYQNQRNLFTKNDIQKLLLECGYEDCYYYSWYQNFSFQEEELLKRIGEIPDFRYTYYTFRAKKK